MQINKNSSNRDPGKEKHKMVAHLPRVISQKHSKAEKSIWCSNEKPFVIRSHRVLSNLAYFFYKGVCVGHVFKLIL